MEKIGIFGGTFNPCHTEHFNMAKAFIKEVGLDRLFVVPTCLPPHKSDAFLAPAEDRIAMLTAMFEGEKEVEISDYEVKKGGLSYSYQTVEYFKAAYPDFELYFLVGTDMLSNFSKWKEPQRLLKNATLCLVARSGEDTEEAEREYYSVFQKPFIKLEYVGGKVSSTKARVAIALSVGTDEYISSTVAEYAVKRRLYNDKYADFVQKNLPIKRLKHTFGVCVLAQEYAKRLGESVYKAYVASLLHDCAKYLDPADFDYAPPEGVPSPVVHQFLGAHIAQTVLKIDDADIINAICYHTTGRAGMSTLEKIVFLADLLEEGRAYQGVEELRAAVDADFEKGFAFCVGELYRFLVAGGGDVYYLTKECRDYYAQQT